MNNLTGNDAMVSLIFFAYQVFSGLSVYTILKLLNLLFVPLLFNLNIMSRQATFDKARFNKAILYSVTYKSLPVGNPYKALIFALLFTNEEGFSK